MSRSPARAGAERRRAAAGQGSEAAATRCAYLGPKGTFCEQAVAALHPAADLETIPCGSIEATFEAVRTGAAARAVVPIESSVEGGVSATIDELAVGDLLRIGAEVLIPVEFALLARPGTALEDIKTVGGHPVAQPQCRHWLARNLPEAEWRPAPSNADAARLVADGQVDAALAGAFAAAEYGLAALVVPVSDNPYAVTRFVEIGPPGPLPYPTGRDRTSVIVPQLADDRPGGLMDLLSQFATRGVNLTRIESRPIGDGIGRYFFCIDCEGHVAQASVGEALMGLHRISSEVRFLGSYARAAGPPPAPRPGAGLASAPTPGRRGRPGGQAGAYSDEAFAEAASWLTRMRAGLG